MHAMMTRADNETDLATHVVDEFFCHFDPAAVLEVRAALNPIPRLEPKSLSSKPIP